MARAVRAIIIENGKLLVMYRNKLGSEYYTLVGGRVNDGETLEQGLVREVEEETGLKVTSGRPVFHEKHAAPYNEQFIYVCEVAPHGEIALQDQSEEGRMNQLDINVHHPRWVNGGAFAELPFRTPQLQAAVLDGLKRGFPTNLIEL